MDGEQARFENRAHFFAIAARSMRLVDHARRRLADKRGGEQQQVELDQGIALNSPSIGRGAGAQALDRLERMDARQGLGDSWGAFLRCRQTGSPFAHPTGECDEHENRSGDEWNAGYQRRSNWVPGARSIAQTLPNRHSVWASIGFMDSKTSKRRVEVVDAGGFQRPSKNYWSELNRHQEVLSSRRTTSGLDLAWPVAISM
jgi:hypothetical protein